MAYVQNAHADEATNALVNRNYNIQRDIAFGAGIVRDTGGVRHFDPEDWFKAVLATY